MPRSEMETRIYPIDDGSLDLAKRILANGGVVAFPTETVYGLGANAFDDAAVDEIFRIKGRPNDNPLIVHVHDGYDLDELVEDIPDYAARLSEKFLPGPLTMVYRSRGTVSKAVSCGLDTLAIRVPSHEGAQRFLKYVGLPVAAPSANISKHVSPVTAQHVLSDLDGRIECILDGGTCTGGIESTVLDCTGEFPKILRSGLVTREMIEEVVGRCDEYVLKDGEPARSPGMKYKHYSPKCRTMLFSREDTRKALDEYDMHENRGERVWLLCDSATASVIRGRNILDLGETERDVAHNLYMRLREGEDVADLIIAICPEKSDGIMTGVLNRLTKACRSE